MAGDPAPPADPATPGRAPGPQSRGVPPSRPARTRWTPPPPRWCPAGRWHAASGSELVLLRIALELAPGGLLGDGLPRLDDSNTSAVVTAVAELADGRYLKPDWADL